MYNSDSQNIIAVLENISTIMKKLERQREVLERLKNENALTTNALPTCNTFSIIPEKPFKKMRKLLEYDNSLKNNATGKREMVILRYIFYTFTYVGYFPPEKNAFYTYRHTTLSICNYR